MQMKKQPSPCLQCTRVPVPGDCENKSCKLWQAWFINRWEQLRQLPRQQMEKMPARPVGVPLGGRHYAAPHQVETYLSEDPCEGCKCPRELCSTPCRVKRAWQEAKKEVML